MSQRIYLDNNATTRVDPRIIPAIVESLSQHDGNPSSLHWEGQNSRKALSSARNAISSYLKAKPTEIIFTSGGTEALSTMIRAFCEGTKGHIISSNVEHSCVFKTLNLMETLGWSVSYLPVGTHGAVTAKAVHAEIKPDTKLIVLIGANNETGIKTDIEAIAAIAHTAHIPLIIDGVAMIGKEPLSIPPGVSAICFSGHKFHAPKGVGFAFIRPSFKMKPLLLGGEQEFGKRSGTENLPGIIGMAEAIKLMEIELPLAWIKIQQLRDRFEKNLFASLSEIHINGQGIRIPNTSNLCFSGVDGETLLMALDTEGIAASHGSACSSGALEPSRILLSMGLPMAVAKSSLRFSLSRFTTEEEIDRSVETLIRLVKRLRR